jgi:O-antigen/teichoic acid export membrane protein
MARYAVPLIPRQCARNLTLFVNRRILLHYHSLDVVGLYGMGARLAMTFDILMNAVALSLMPLVLAHHQERETPAKIALIFKYTAAAGMLGFVVYSLFAREGLLVFTTREYLPAAGLVPLIFLGRFLFCLQVFAAGMWVHDRTRLLGLVNILGILLDVWLNLRLVPALGMLGTALASCLVGTCCFTLSMAGSQKLYPVPHKWRPLLLGALACAGTACLGMAIRLPWLPAVALKLLLVVLALLSLVLLRVVDRNEIGQVAAWIARRRAVGPPSQGRP